MKIVRFELQQRIEYGVVDEDSIFSIEGNICGQFSIGKKLCGLSEVRLLSPVQPKIVVGVGGNYYGLLKAAGMEIPSEPSLFLKPSSSVVGHLDNIVYPKISNDVRFGGELAVVVKYEARNVTEDRALEYVLGYACGNDLTARDLQDRSPTRNKSFYTSCPLGPCVATDINAANLRIKSRLNGILIQDDSTSDMIFSVNQIISYITEFMALEPFDVILTGTSRKETKINIGDTIEVEIEGIGVLRNTVTKYSI
jgi:2-keto-4-pentenoate hydratase/2-oxohepta-3-ene-1,7-dioic acid hydratase in catechol pathway